MISRRSFLSTGAATVASFLLFPKGKRTYAQQAPVKKSKENGKLILLGTMGGGRLTKGRATLSQVIILNGLLYVIDCGYAVGRQLVLAGCDLKKLKAVFITHHHDDHDLDYGNLLHLARMCGLREKVQTYGPYPLKKIWESFLEANDYSFNCYRQLGMLDLKPLIEVQEISRDGIVMEDENVKVTGVNVDHPPIPAFGFRFDTKERSITISGDTAFCPELVELAKGSDVLVHEVLYKPALIEMGQRLPQYKGLVSWLLKAHTIVEDAGKVAQEAGVKTLVLTHFVPGDNPKITDEMWAEGARKYFKGEVIVGKDFMEI
jgi:ribonuclease BN (tRNA processing enzyme)